MSIWFLVAYERKRLDTVDTAWGLGFVVVAWSVYAQQPSTRSLMIAVLVSIWGVRLAYHIWRRSQRHSNDDPRYTELSSHWKGNYWVRAYYSIFLLQGALIMMASLPIVMAAGELINGRTWLTWLGLIIWLFGFIFEAIADQQLAEYLQLKNKPKVVQPGLWRYSRHPNYFGELVQWWAIGIIALQVWFGWVGLFGPLILSYLIIFVSGIPPIEKRRVKDPEYKAYQLQTSALIPLPPTKSKV